MADLNTASRKNVNDHEDIARFVEYFFISRLTYIIERTRISFRMFFFLDIFCRLQLAILHIHT